MSNTAEQQAFNSLSSQEKINKGLEITRKLIQGFQNEEMITIPDGLQSYLFFGMEVSPFPTESKKIMKYILTEQLHKVVDKKNFEQVHNYCVIFVNVEDLSYHNFENILNLDHLFDKVSFEISKKKNFKKKAQLFDMSGSMDTLLSLDKLNFYTVPLNNSQRGGKRLIFHSNQLSYALTQMINESEFFDKKNFSHVNNVFRLNNFAPGDKKFKSHYDTPFADQSKELYSKYTLIIYLTGNKANKNDKSSSPAPLRIEEIVLDKIKANQCVIFDQKCEHEGNAYADQDKIFIRTELIYKIEGFQFDEKIAQMFNMACYMTREPQQQQYSADLFNSCVKMRYNKEDEKIPRVYLMKKNLDNVYVTDGNFFWFSNQIELKSMAVLAVLDYFNGKVYNLENVKIQSKALPRKRGKETKEEQESDEHILNMIELASFNEGEDHEERIRDYQDPRQFVPDTLCDNFTIFQCFCGLGGGERTTADTYFQDEKLSAIHQLQRIMDKKAVLIFDHNITINYDQITIEMDQMADIGAAPSGKIRFNDFYINTKNKINFASCQCENQYDEDKVVRHETQKVHTFCLPDITFWKLDNGVKLSIDIFNNGFVYQSTDTFKQPYTDQSKLKRRDPYGDNDDDDEDEEENLEEEEEEEDDNDANSSDSQNSDVEDKDDFIEINEKDKSENSGEEQNEDSEEDSEKQSKLNTKRKSPYKKKKTQKQQKKMFK